MPAAASGSAAPKKGVAAVRARIAVLVLLLALPVLMGLSGPAVAAGTEAAASAAAPSYRSTPDLIDAALARGEITRGTALRYLTYALLSPSKVPAAYRGEAPYHGTSLLLRLRREVKTLPAGAAKTEVSRALAAPDPGTFCDVLSTTPLPDNVQTAHFYVEYDAAALDESPDGLTIEDYLDSLEHSWQMEVDAFGWWRPPVYPDNPAPGGKYHVRIEPTMAPVLYGFVSNFGTYAGPVGNSPHTAWNDQDADASCMGLNNDYSLFPGTPRRALDATTAHEFNHSIQFGVGGLSGPNAPDSIWIEGGATWMEDEAYDSSNDNYNYLWPSFENDMGEYEDSPYPYWITFRGLTERYGSSVAGGGEDVFQRFWELTSRNKASNLNAMNLALKERGTTLKDAYHAYAIAVKYNRACGGGYAYPYCFQEGPQYVNGDGTQTGAGQTAAHGQINAIGGSFQGMLPDNYSLNWIQLPANGAYRVFLRNTSAGGQFRLTVVCDLGTGFRRKPAAAVANTGQLISIGEFSTTGCVSRPVAVITNQRQTAPDPASSTDRSFTLEVKPKN